MKKRVFVLGIDGVPYPLITKFIADGKLKHLEKRIPRKNIREIKSVYPVISSVAWTSFATGCNVAQHGIFGFVDRTANPFQVTLSTSNDRMEDAIWTTLSKQGKKVIVINVPITYPVEPINGKMISCFLCPDIRKGTYPKSLISLLEKYHYSIDADAWLARSNKEKFLEQVLQVLEARCRVALELLEDNWNYFHLHIMETDRLMHFFWDDIENDKSLYHPGIMKFFEKLDVWIGKLLDRVEEDTPCCILSDHGFCGIKKEVQMNTWLKKQGYLVMGEDPYDINAYNENTTCYSLLPGRFYINLKGREEHGSVSKEDYDMVRADIRRRLLEMKDPENGEKIIDRVFFREEIYAGNQIENAADIIAHPNNGYDLKGLEKSNRIFTHSALTGMHTYENAVIMGRGIDVQDIYSVTDVRKKLMQLFED